MFTARMRKEERLTRSSQFAAVFKEDKYWANDFMVIKAMPNGLKQSRFGFVTSKKVGNAVVRNRVRRLLREAVRLTPIESGWDIVIIARKEAAGKNYHQVEPKLRKLLNRAELLGQG